MALALDGSRGFTQIGVLIALGIAFAGVFMTTVFLPFSHRAEPPRHAENWMFILVKNYVRFSVRKPGRCSGFQCPSSPA